MKLVIQIPCYNEEATLPGVLARLPHQLPGFDAIEVLVVDDGSTDGTSEVARRAGAHVVRHARNRGLAAAFQTGLNACLERGADVIVNTDGDGQYPGEKIQELVAPILAGAADMVIADRRIGGLQRLPLSHRLLQRIGSAVVRKISGTQVPDAPSGFRALSRETALRTEILTDYSYTLESLIQAGRLGLRLEFLPVDTLPPTRESRLKASQWQYVRRSAMTILRLYALYRPLKTFILLSLPFFLAGSALWIRYAVLWIRNDAGRGAHIQSVVVGGVLLLIAGLLGALGVLGDILAKSRELAERALVASKRALYSPAPDHAEESEGNVRSARPDPNA